MISLSSPFWKFIYENDRGQKRYIMKRSEELEEEYEHALWIVENYPKMIFEAKMDEIVSDCADRISLEIINQIKSLINNGSNT